MEQRARIQLLRSADYVNMPWVNGLGTTLELARCDDLDGGLLWRCSIADVVQPAPFSSFPGIERTLMLLSGKGFVFESPPHSPLELRVPGQFVSFSGDVSSGAGEVFGPSQDVNVLTKAGRFRVTTRILTSSARFFVAAQTIVFVYVQSGVWLAACDDQELEIRRTESLLMESPLDQSISISGSGSLAVVELVHRVVV